MLDKASLPYNKILAEENTSLVAKYDITQAPTMIVEHAGACAEKYVGVAEIKKYIEREEAKKASVKETVYA